ncbi:uncharacterized protein IL334_002324 [Kwoniella shivajii]|uniref:Uncharacterized protein n=1 Tax=Kwoniella shivajii TaxID=564305 RepID=A0ABZ1CUF9_9TREE|nr:hypothetical protein IL334_002324 [Kwoniella shivajii]
MTRSAPVSHPDRPFSPSPPRENRHSASRPPSILLGAPPVGTVATSSTFNISGLPSTPPHSHPFTRKFPSHEDVRDLKSLHYDNVPRTRHESVPSSVRGDPFHQDYSQGRPVSIRSSRIRSDSESSTTSSASPPLGATSLLAAMAATTPLTKGQQTPEKSPNTHRGHTPTASEGTNPQTPKYDAHGSPKSFESTYSSSSSFLGGMSASKSLPRLHQPTVVRRTSGRGLAFLPPPAQISSPSTLAQHHPQSPRASMSSSSRKGKHPSIVSLEHIQHAAHMVDLGRPLDVSNRERERDSLISMKASETDIAFEPLEYSDIPLPPSPDDSESLHEVKKVAEATVRPVLLVHQHNTDSSLSQTSFHLSASVMEEAFPPNVLFDSHDRDPVPAEEQKEAGRSCTCDLTDARNTPAEESEDHMVRINQALRIILIFSQLHEVSSDIRIASSVVRPASAVLTETRSIAPPIGEAGKPDLPYKPRKGAPTFKETSPSSKNNTREISVFATLNHPSLPLPQLTSHRLELCLAWGNAQILQWVPGRRYIPNWNLKIVRGSSENPSVIDVRVVVKTVMSKLPILWRFASWI